VANQYRKLPNLGGTPREVAEVVNNLVEGKVNSTGVFQLSASSTTTTIEDLRVNPNSVILWTPKSSNAAQELTHLYLSVVGKQTFTLTHRSNANTGDIIFHYAVFG
tara:strand:+ start:1026 stop:1343 length:318 start_codon:yes stop_codon:yes gene_type:complete